MLTVSASSTPLPNEPKGFVYGFKPYTVNSLEHLGWMANRQAIAGPVFQDGRRTGSNALKGSRVILIDCDEEGASEILESKLYMYDYVKVPSASNLSHPYKWHYFIPTQEPLSIFPAAYRWQVEQFFNQVGITDDLIDTTGSYDLARQFAPASIGMTEEEADDRIEVNEEDLMAPIMAPPPELCVAGAKSITATIKGEATDTLPEGHLWFNGQAVSFESVEDAVHEAHKAGGNIRVSGFGCPHDNHNHSRDRRRGYGFAWVTDSGDVLVKCSGDSCKDSPIFAVPKAIVLDEWATLEWAKDIDSRIEASNTTCNNTQVPDDFVFSLDTEPVEAEPEGSSIMLHPISPELYRSTMENHWTKTLGQVKANGLDENWILFADTMNRVINENGHKTRSSRGTAHIVPMATGESKTQGAVVYTSLLNKHTNVRAMIVVFLTADADADAAQINELGGDAVAFHSKADIDIDDASEYKTVIVSHEFFKRNGHAGNEKWQTLAGDRDLFIIDEALQDVQSVSLDDFNLKQIEHCAHYLKDEKVEKVASDHIATLTESLKWEAGANGFMQASSIDIDLPMSAKVYEDVFGDYADFAKEHFTRKRLAFESQERVKQLINTLSKHPLTDPFVCRNRRIKQHSLEWYYRAELTQDLEALATIEGAGAFVSKKSQSITGVRELLPNQISFAVLDATAPVNSLYQLQDLHRQNIRKVPVMKTRNYSNFIIKTARTQTGKGSLPNSHIRKMLDNIQASLNDGDKLLIVTHKSHRDIASAWVESYQGRKEGVVYAVAHFGNITGKNDWRDFNCIAVLGLPHKPTEVTQALNIVKTSESLAYSDSGKSNHTSIAVSGIASELVQAMARIRVRNIIDLDGNCLPARAWVTLNRSSIMYQGLESAIQSQFTGATFEQWELGTLTEETQRLPKGFEGTLEYLDTRLSTIGADMEIYEPRDTLDIQTKSYSRLIKAKVFKEQLESLGIEVQERKAVTTRGRPKKRPLKVFVKVK